MSLLQEDYLVEGLKKILKDYPDCITGPLLEINSFLEDNLSEYRYEHSLQTLKNGMELARRNSLDAGRFMKLATACLAHDVTKEMPAHFHKEIFERNQVPGHTILPHTLYHSFSAPYFLAEHFSITDSEILHAVKYHSTGNSEMPLLSRIVFAADFLASRIAGKKDNLNKETLANICLEKLVTTIEFLVNKKIPVQTDSINFYNTLIREIQDEEDHGQIGEFQ